MRKEMVHRLIPIFIHIPPRAQSIDTTTKDPGIGPYPAHTSSGPSSGMKS